MAQFLGDKTVLCISVPRDECPRMLPLLWKRLGEEYDGLHLRDRTNVSVFLVQNTQLDLTEWTEEKLAKRFVTAHESLSPVQAGDANTIPDPQVTETVYTFRHPGFDCPINPGAKIYILDGPLSNSNTGPIHEDSIQSLIFDMIREVISDSKCVRLRMPFALVDFPVFPNSYVLGDATHCREAGQTHFVNLRRNVGVNVCAVVRADNVRAGTVVDERLIEWEVKPTTIIYDGDKALVATYPLDDPADDTCRWASVMCQELADKFTTKYMVDMGYYCCI